MKDSISFKISSAKVGKCVISANMFIRSWRGVLRRCLLYMHNLTRIFVLKATCTQMSQLVNAPIGILANLFEYYTTIREGVLGSTDDYAGMENLGLLHLPLHQLRRRFYRHKWISMMVFFAAMVVEIRRRFGPGNQYRMDRSMWRRFGPGNQYAMARSSNTAFPFNMEVRYGGFHGRMPLAGMVFPSRFFSTYHNNFFQHTHIPQVATVFYAYHVLQKFWSGNPNLRALRGVMTLYVMVGLLAWLARGRRNRKMRGLNRMFDTDERSNVRTDLGAHVWPAVDSGLVGAGLVGLRNVEHMMENPGYRDPEEQDYRRRRLF